MTSEQEISDNQPASVHFASPPFPAEGPFTCAQFQAD